MKPSINFLPISKEKRNRLVIRIFSITSSSRAVLRLYQSLAFFAIFSSDDFVKGMGFKTQAEKQDQHRLIRHKLLTTATDEVVGETKE